ncbi:hypothetical protein, partial [Mesorhizobium sp. M1E.F.Ca.ET.063.01.1.1]|uniref:hypothetical protein n=1 Tax=Mesorhizobium sp. M1E.F.Ca.ET.063.01.1.1 TaxID=2496750 RepID=UPI001AECCA57
ILYRRKIACFVASRLAMADSAQATESEMIVAASRLFPFGSALKTRLVKAVAAGGQEPLPSGF